LNYNSTLLSAANQGIQSIYLRKRCRNEASPESWVGSQ